MFCGNGGSAADAQHLAAELVGRSAERGVPLAGLALTTDSSVLTAVANDEDYGEVFVRQIRALGLVGDTLVAISTSGRSVNVVRGATVARGLGLHVVALVGPSPCDLDEFAEVCIHLPGSSSGSIQQGHLLVGHVICEIVDGALSALPV